MYLLGGARRERTCHMKRWGAVTEHNCSTGDTPYHPKLQTQVWKGPEGGRTIRTMIPRTREILQSLRILGPWQNPLTRYLICFSKPLYWVGMIFIVKGRKFYSEGFRVMGLSRDPCHSKPEGSPHRATWMGISVDNQNVARASATSRAK